MQYIYNNLLFNGLSMGSRPTKTLRQPLWIKVARSLNCRRLLIKKKIADALSVPVENILLACTHTHTGCGTDYQCWGTPAEPEVAEFAGDVAVAAAVESIKANSVPVSDSELQEILQTTPPDRLAEVLVGKALEGGGPDNITVGILWEESEAQNQ